MSTSRNLVQQCRKPDGIKSSRPSSYIARTYATQQHSLVSQCCDAASVQRFSSVRDDSEDDWKYLDDELETQADDDEETLEDLIFGSKDSVLMFGQSSSSSSSISRLLSSSMATGSCDQLDALMEIVDNSNAGQTTTERESVDELLSGPKDSVMMFGTSYQPYSQALQLDPKIGEDPLDVLAREVDLRSGPSQAKVLALRCQDELKELHRTHDDFELSRLGSVANCGVACQELELEDIESQDIGASRQMENVSIYDTSRRHELHHQLDLFLNSAVKDVKPENSPRDKKCSDDVQVLQKLLQCQEEKIHSLEESLTSLRMEKAEAVLARDEFQADFEVSQLELWDARQQLEKLRNDLDMAEEIEHLHRLESRDAHTKLEARLAAQEELMESISREAEAELQENHKLRGERQALQSLSSGELTALAVTLMESLQRVQSAQQRKLQEATDERLCAVCLTEPKNVVLQPCNHLLMCTGCFAKCNDYCPQCRARVREHLVVFS